MSKYIYREYGTEKEILKINDFKGLPLTVQSEGITADEYGHKIVKAGTPLSIDGKRAVTSDGKSNVVGLLLKAVDLQYGNTPGTYIFEGTVNNKVLKENGIEITAEERLALPRITFVD